MPESTPTPAATPLRRSRLALILGPVAVMVVMTQIADALWPDLVTSAPELLIAFELPQPVPGAGRRPDRRVGVLPHRHGAAHGAGSVPLRARLVLRTRCAHVDGEPHPHRRFHHASGREALRPLRPPARGAHPQQLRVRHRRGQPHVAAPVLLLEPHRHRRTTRAAGLAGRHLPGPHRHGARAGSPTTASPCWWRRSRSWRSGLRPRPVAAARGWPRCTSYRPRRPKPDPPLSEAGSGRRHRARGADRTQT